MCVLLYVMCVRVCLCVCLCAQVGDCQYRLYGRHLLTLSVLSGKLVGTCAVAFFCFVFAGRMLCDSYCCSHMCVCLFVCLFVYLFCAVRIGGGFEDFLVFVQRFVPLAIFGNSFFLFAVLRLFCLFYLLCFLNVQITHYLFGTHAHTHTHTHTEPQVVRALIDTCSDRPFVSLCASNIPDDTCVSFCVWGVYFILLKIRFCCLSDPGYFVLISRNGLTYVDTAQQITESTTARTFGSKQKQRSEAQSHCRSLSFDAYSW